MPEPRSFAERSGLADACVEGLGLTMPVLLDGLENAAERAYAGWPERLYVLARGGVVAYQGGKGPFGFDPEELEAFLRAHLHQPG